MSHMTNPLATPDQLFQRRSFGALPIDLQDAIFFAAQCLTQAAGILLELPQSVTAQANVLLARYWLVESMMSHEFSDVSAATLCLTAKLSPHPRSPRDVALVYGYLLSPSTSLFHAPTDPPPPPLPTTPSFLSESHYQSFHTRLLHLESQILYALSFDTHVALPHPLAVTYLQALDFFALPPASSSHNPTTTDTDKDTKWKKTRETLASRALSYLNTALLSPQLLYLTHQPPALAVAAVYSAARDVGAKMPDCAWWEVFDVEREELGFLVVGMRSVEGWGRRCRAGEVIRGWGGGGKSGMGMVTRGDVERELRGRGVEIVGGGGSVSIDAEEEAARRMDEKMAGMEEAAS